MRRSEEEEEVEEERCVLCYVNIRKAKTAPETYLGQDGFHIPPPQEKEYLRGGSRPKTQRPKLKITNLGLGSHVSNPFNFNPKIFCSIFYVLFVT